MKKNINNFYQHTLTSGLNEIKHGNLEKGKKYFRKLIDINNKRYEGYLNLSNILVLEKNEIDAVHLLQNYIRLFDKHPEIINGLAIIFFNSKNYNNLIKHINLYIDENDNYLLNFRKYFEDDPKNPLFFHYVRGIGYKFVLNN